MSRAGVCWGLALAVMIAGTPSAQEKDQEYQDWAMRCPEKEPCVLEQRVFVEGMEQGPLVHVAFQVLKQSSELLVVLRVPLNVLLAPGLQLKVGQRTPQTLPFHHCRAEGCVSLFVLTPELRRSLVAGREAQLSFHMLDGRRVGVPVSLLGVTAGLKALDDTAASRDRGQ